MSHRFYRLAHIAAVALSFTLVFAIVAFAQERRQGEPGRFDYYVLALSWSPSYCEATQNRSARVLAAIRPRFPFLLPGAGTAARPRHRRKHA